MSCVRRVISYWDAVVGQSCAKPGSLCYAGLQLVYLPSVYLPFGVCAGSCVPGIPVGGSGCGQRTRCSRVKGLWVESNIELLEIRPGAANSRGVFRVSYGTAPPNECWGVCSDADGGPWAGWGCTRSPEERPTVFLEAFRLGFALAVLICGPRHNVINCAHEIRSVEKGSRVSPPNKTVCGKLAGTGGVIGTSALLRELSAGKGVRTRVGCVMMGSDVS